jgi:hypothetical protein
VLYVEDGLVIGITSFGVQLLRSFGLAATLSGKQPPADR